MPITQLLTKENPEATPHIKTLTLNGCKVTLRFNDTSNPEALSSIKNILSSACFPLKCYDNLHK